MPIPLLVDTDLGSDIDDELTLAFLWGSPEIDLRGVVASYGDPALRTRIGIRMGELAGRPLAIVPGEAVTMSGREIWWAGHEGDAYGPLDGIPLPEAEPGPSAGVRLIAEQTAAEPGTQLLAVSPLTTVATALRADPGLAERLGHLWVMAGDWADPSAVEHNVLSDVAAARVVFAATCPITVIGIDVTRQVHLLEEHIDAIEATGELGRILAVQARAWMRRWGEPFEIPHDPLTALAIIRPDLFDFSDAGTVDVSDGTDGRAEGSATHEAGDGSVRVATGVDAASCVDEIVARILRGLAAPRP